MSVVSEAAMKVLERVIGWILRSPRVRNTYRQKCLKGTFKKYIQGASSWKLDQPVYIGKAQRNHECMVVELPERGNAAGTIALWLHLSPKLERAQMYHGHSYVFSSSGGYAPETSFVYNCFALVRTVDPTDTTRSEWVFEMTCRDKNYVRSGGVPDSELEEGWHHFACVWKGGHSADDAFAQLYIDGRLRPQPIMGQPVSGAIPDVRGKVPFMIGTWTNLLASYYIEQKVAWVAYYDRALSVSEVERLFQLGEPE